MKLFSFIPFFLYLALPLLAGDAPKPEPLQQAVREYVHCFNTGIPWLLNDYEKNHVIWKLYVYDPIYPERGTPDRILAGLTPYPEDHLYVMLNINLLWDSLNRTPKPGDIIVVEGFIHDRDKNTLVWRMDPATGETREEPLTFLTLFSQHAAIWTGEKSATPTVTLPTPMVRVTPTMTSQGVTTK